MRNFETMFWKIKSKDPFIFNFRGTIYYGMTSITKLNFPLYVSQR